MSQANTLWCFSFFCSYTPLLENTYLACTALDNPSGTSHTWLHLHCFHVSCTAPWNLLGGRHHGFLPCNTQLPFLQLLLKASHQQSHLHTEAWDIFISKRFSVLPVGQVMVVLLGTSTGRMGSHHPNLLSKLSKDISFTSCYGEDPNTKIALPSWPHILHLKAFCD